ncbi:hypothetical protein [Corynebacterium flavescens]|uniref:hypothetical protein n=1 Tax=Corynebacterium flavescens TaxID=28028 RepID=UPI002648210F|nr:hypothetical protein [Corynebacterium flavescens]
MLKEHGIQSPEVLLTFSYNTAGFENDELEQWHCELRRNFLHWIISNAVSVERDGLKIEP